VRATHIVHAADLHLDSPLLGLERYDGAPVDQVRGATRQALTSLVDLCLEREAALLLLAGDLFDGTWKDCQSGLFLLSELRRLRETGTRVLIVHGNHDAGQGALSSWLTLPEHVSRFRSDRSETLVFEDLGVAVHGQSYARLAVTEDLAAGYPAPTRGLVNIGLLHTNVGGSPLHENYAPSRLDQLTAHGYDYWALGHVHQYQVLSRAPWVVYSGCTQGRHAKETGPKGCVLLSVGSGEISGVEFVATDAMRWSQVRVEAGADDRSLDEVLARIESALTEERRVAEPRLVAARVVLSGACPAHGELIRQPEDTERGVRALDVEGVWVEKVVLGTRPHVPVEKLRAGGGALGELLTEIERIRASGETDALLAPLAECWSKVRPALGPEHDLDLGSGEAVLPLLDSAEGLLVSLLQDEAGDA
jgi:DNA repair exonuclease SbcCD nuclease subunit